MFGGIRGDETMVIQAPGDQLLFPCTGAQVLCISYVVINKCRKVRSPLHNLCTPALPAEVTVRDAQEQGELSIHLMLILSIVIFCCPQVLDILTYMPKTSYEVIGMQLASV